MDSRIVRSNKPISLQSGNMCPQSNPSSVPCMGSDDFKSISNYLVDKNQHSTSIYHIEELVKASMSYSNNTQILTDTQKLMTKYNQTTESIAQQNEKAFFQTVDYLLNDVSEVLISGTENTLAQGSNKKTANSLKDPKPLKNLIDNLAGFYKRSV